MSHPPSPGPAGPAPRGVLIDSFPESAFRYLEWDALVCIDVMLASTAIVTALGQGRRTFVAADTEAARALAGGWDAPLVRGSDDGAPRAGLDGPDSPTELEAAAPERPLVTCSPPGTELLLNTRTAACSLVLSFGNLSATAEWLTPRCNRVAIIGAGVREEFSCEDQMAAAWLAERLVGRGYQPCSRRTADLIQRWSGIEPRLAAWGNSAARLDELGCGAEVEWVISHVDDSPVVARLHGAEVVRADGEPVDTAERAGHPGGPHAAVHEVG